MIEVKGTGVFGGIAFGKIAFYKRKENMVKRYHIDDVDTEIKRFEAAKLTAIQELKKLYEKALEEVGEANALIFEMHQMMIDDGDYCDSITNIISSQSVNAEYAVATTSDNFSEMFAAMDSEYMQERAADVKDISERLISVLTGLKEQQIESSEPVILVADDLAPSETVQLNKDMILSFVTMYGSTNSHTAILARMMNIPAIVGAGDSLLEDFDGKEAIVDGFSGVLYVEPDDETIAAMTKKKEEDEQKKALLESLKGKENVTLDGQHIKLYANIGGVGDVAVALENDCGGVGLFRSEFLYLNSDHYPSENEQFQAYKQALENMAGKEVVIRTLDIGADKQIDYFDLPQEENPAMGYRAVRICLDRTEVFKTQLRALYRASSFGKLAIMIPMITSVEEIQEVKEIVNQVKTELDEKKIPYDKEVLLGIMIETPAAVMISDLLAKEVDFFSVGTNDLTQYTLALDRQNLKLAKYYKPKHKGILRMLKMLTENAHKEGIWVGICGELAADTTLTETFLSIGIDELSVSPPYILPLREKVRGINVSEIKDTILDEIVH